MPAITATTVAGTQLAQVLQDVLKTPQNEWDYFFIRPNLIENIFEELTNTIRSRNFFNEDYSIKTFFDFLKSYVNVKLIQDNLNNIDSVILMKFNDVWISIQNRIIQQQGLNEEKCEIIKSYIGFIHDLLVEQHRDLFTKAEITFTKNDFQNITVMLQHSSVGINAELIESYTSLLKLSFDTPKFLANFELGLGVIPLAKASFLNKEINIHITSTRFFGLLDYQGQLLDYYHKDARFNITNQLLADANVELKRKAIELQTYFFKHLQERNDIDKPLLQHYLYTYFFKGFFERYPDQINVLKTDMSLLEYIKFDYVALPKKLICKNFPPEYVVHIEYDNLPAKVPKMACEAISCSYKTNENWKQDLNLPLPRFNSHYTFRVADSYAKYSVTYSYGYAPVGGGFYIQKPRINGTVYGEGYSYWENDTHNFIDVSRHEARHHDNYVFTSEAYNINPKIMGITVKSPSEGLAVNANGPCAPAFIDSDFSNVTAPSFSNLFEEPFIGYFASWLDTNYLIQEHPDFYRDSLSLDKQQFKQRWEPLLIKNQQQFRDWLPILKQSCKSAPRKLTVENCPSIFLKEYGSVAELNKLTTQSVFSNPTEALPKLGFLTTKKPTRDEMGYQLIFTISRRKLDEFRTLLQNGANPNYLAEDTGDTPLHFLYYYGNCDVKYLELLLSYGAKVTPNLQGRLPLQIAEKHCNAMELLKIQETFARHAQQQKLALTIVMPITSFINGVISGWSGEVMQRNSQSRYIPNIIFYGLKPATLAMSNSAINILLAGSAEAIGLNDIGLSFSYYLLVNYMGLMLAQFGERITSNIENKFLNIVMSILLYTFFLNPSLMITLLTEGFMAPSFQNILWPLLSLLSGGILFKAGEYSGQKSYEKFFPIHSADTVNSQQDYFLRYSLDGSPKEISVDQKTLKEIKKKLSQLKLEIEKHINKQVYQLNFNQDLISANDAISTLIEIISKDDNNELAEYKAEFTAVEKSLYNIQRALTQLNQCNSGKTKIQSLRDETTKISAMLRGIRPLPQVSSTVPDILPQRDQIDEEQSQTPLLSFNNKLKNQLKQRHQHTRPPTMLGKMYNFFIRPVETELEFPDPPTDQEIQAMGLLTTENPRTLCQNSV